MNAYFNLEDFDGLEKLIPEIPENDPLLIELGDK